MWMVEWMWALSNVVGKLGGTASLSGFSVKPSFTRFLVAQRHLLNLMSVTTPNHHHHQS
jgi:hypothetical protein